MHGVHGSPEAHTHVRRLWLLIARLKAHLQLQLFGTQAPASRQLLFFVRGPFSLHLRTFYGSTYHWQASQQPPLMSQQPSLGPAVGGGAGPSRTSAVQGMLARPLLLLPAIATATSQLVAVVGVGVRLRA